MKRKRYSAIYICICNSAEKVARGKACSSHIEFVSGPIKSAWHLREIGGVSIERRNCFGTLPLINPNQNYHASSIFRRWDVEGRRRVGSDIRSRNARSLAHITIARIHEPSLEPLSVGASKRGVHCRCYY